MGMEERVLADISAEWIWRLMDTKWDDSFSAASMERRGAQRLQKLRGVRRGWGLGDKMCVLGGDKGGNGGRVHLRFTITDVSFHFINWDFCLGLLLEAAPSHLYAHDVSGDTFIPALFVFIANDENHVESG